MRNGRQRACGHGAATRRSCCAWSTGNGHKHWLGKSARAAVTPHRHATTRPTFKRGYMCRGRAEAARVGEAGQPHLPACCIVSGNDAGRCPTHASTTGGVRGCREAPPLAAARASSPARPPAVPPPLRGSLTIDSARFTSSPKSSGAIFSSWAACSGLVDHTMLL